MLDVFVLPGVPPVVFWGFVSVAVLIQGISKSGFAGGAGILSLPLMMLVMPVDKVAASLLILLILCDFNAIYHHRHNKVWSQVMAIFIPSIPGTLIAAVLWWWVGTEGVERFAAPIKIFTGVIAIVFALYIAVREVSMAWVAQHRAGPGMAVLAGVTAGFTSTIAHAAGPIVSLYMFSQNLGKSYFIGTVAWTFTLINLFKLPIFVATGLIDRHVLLFDLVLVPLIPVGSFIGHRMHLKVSEWLFNRIIMVLRLLAGVQLVFNVNLVQRGLEYLLQ